VFDEATIYRFEIENTGDAKVDKTIDVTVSRLRTKLGHCLPDGAHIITTVRNAGYLLTTEVKDV